MDDQRPGPVARVAAAGAVAAALGLLLAPIPANWLGVWHNQLLDFGHVPLFAALLLTLDRGMGRPHSRAVLAAVALAGLVELIQPVVGRTGDWWDFLRGALGGLAAAAVLRAWECRHSPVRAVAYLALAIAFPLWPLVEVAPFVADTVEGYRAFPELAGFSTDRQILRWNRKQAILSRTEEGVRVEFHPGPAEYPGVTLRPVVGDFGGYRWLCYDFRAAGEPLVLVTSVRTRSGDPRRTAHADLARHYLAGEHTARIDLAALAARGDPEPLDLSDVRAVLLYVPRPQEPRTITLTRVWLER